MDGNNIENIYIKTNKIIKKIKNKPQPYLIELKTFRHLEHCGPNNDDHLNYRSKKYLKQWNRKCPIKNYKKFLNKNNLVSKKIIKDLDNIIKYEILNAFAFAKRSKFPKKSLLKRFVYA